MSVIRSSMSSTQMLTLMNAAIKAGPPPAAQQQQPASAPALPQHPSVAPQLSAQISSQVSSQLPVSTQGSGRSEKTERDNNRTRPSHSGGAGKASSLPSGLDGKDIPPANPWRDAIQRIQSEEARQQREEEAKKVGQPMLSAFKVTI